MAEGSRDTSKDDLKLSSEETPSPFRRRFFRRFRRFFQSTPPPLEQQESTPRPLEQQEEDFRELDQQEFGLRRQLRLFQELGFEELGLEELRLLRRQQQLRQEWELEGWSTPCPLEQQELEDFRLEGWSTPRPLEQQELEDFRRQELLDDEKAQLESELESAERKKSGLVQALSSDLPDHRRRELQEELESVEKEITSIISQIQDKEKRIAELRGADEEKHRKEESKRLFNDAMKDGHVLFHTNTVLLMGVAGSGKSSVKNLLLDNPPDEARHSTPCRDRVLHIRPVRNELVQSTGNKWEEVTRDDMVRLLAQAIHYLPLKKRKELPNVAVLSASMGQKLSIDKSSSSREENECTTSLLEKAIAGVVDLVIQAMQATPMKTTPSLRESSTESEKGKELFGTKTMRLTDSGGQPQFHDVASLFIRHSSAGLFVMRLTDDFEDHPLDEFYEDGELVGTPSRSHLSHGETIMSLVHSLLSHGQNARLIFIGTFLDQVKNSKNESEKNALLIKMLSPALEENVVYSNLSMDKIIFALNATSRDDTTQSVAKEIRKAVEQSPSLDVDIPLRWFIIELSLQNLSLKLGRGVLRKSECEQLVLTVGFRTNDLEALLDYFDTMCIVHYYPKTLPGVVFVDPQVPLDKVSELTQYAISLREAKEGKSASVVSAISGIWIRFRDEGILTLDILEKFKKHYEKDLFTTIHLIDIMIELMIIAPVSVSTLGDSDSQSPSTEYFMPSLLRSVPPSELESHRVFDSSAEPLLIRFPSGCIRCGIFCCLVVFLMKRCGWQLRRSSGKPVLVSRNCISFMYPKNPCHITLIDSFSYIEIHVNGPQPLCEKLCPTILKSILKGTNSASSNLHYNNDHPDICVFCPHKKHKTLQRHYAEVNVDSGYWLCSKDSNYFGNLETKHEIWISNKKASHPPSLPPKITSDEYRLIQPRIFGEVLPGVYGMGMTTIMVTNEQQSFCWEGHGFKLSIAVESLPMGMDKCLVCIIASIAGKYQFPKDFQPVSAVYWIATIPDRIVFRQPITVSLQHCASDKHLSRLSFASANCPKEGLPLTFEKLDHKTQNFTEMPWYGSVQLDHFSGYCIGTSQSSEDSKQLYSAMLFYFGVRPWGEEFLESYFDVVITKNLDIYIMGMEREYENKNAVCGTSCIFDFEMIGNTINLEIPVTTSGWNIESLISPKMTKMIVDGFKPGCTIPRIQLMARIERDQRCVLTHKLYLNKNCKDNQYITVKLDPVNNQEVKIKQLTLDDILHFTDSQVNTEITVDYEQLVDNLSNTSNISGLSHQNRHMLVDLFRLWRQQSPKNNFKNLIKVVFHLINPDVAKYLCLNCLYSKYHFTDVDLNKEVSDDHIYNIHKQMERWEEVATQLGLTPAEIEAIKEKSPPHNIELKRLYTLQKWKSKGGSTATYRALSEALFNCGCSDALRILCTDLSGSCNENGSSTAQEAAVYVPYPPHTESDVSQVLSIGQLSQTFCLAESQLDTEISKYDNDLYIIAGCFDNYNDYLDKFRLRSAEKLDVRGVQHWERSHQSAMREALRLWVKLNPAAASFRALLAIVLSLGKQQVAHNICAYIEQNVTEDN